MKILWMTTLLFAAVLTSVRGTTETAENVPLQWRTVSNKAALCNDFTRAGFFHRNATDEGAGKWIVFLESGAVCYSNETCNRRYFQSHIREMYSEDALQNGRYGDFDTAEAFSAVKNMKLKGTEFVNPLMTSMRCFNQSQYFPNGRLEIEGRDLFDRSAKHVFADHGHVVVPYCSSDVWLGSDSSRTRSFPQKRGDPDTPCDCFDRECFEYDPTSSGLQFTFRGKTIFQSVLQDLDHIYNLRSASELILIGSSAGGVGALNLAKLVTEKYPNLEVKVVLDSAWFINFRNGINTQFNDLQNAAVGTPSVLTPSSSPAESPTASTDYIQSLTPFDQLPSTSKAGPITSSVSASSHVITSSLSALDHMITSSTIPPVSSSKIDSALLASPTIQSTPSANFAAPSSNIATPSSNFVAPSSNIVTPTPTLDMTSFSGSGSGESFSGINMKRSADTEEDVDRDLNERYQRDANGDSDDLLSLLRTHDACFDTRRGYPCCLSAQCVLTASNQTTNEPYFPRHVQLFVVTSLYDAFILSQTLQDVEVYQSDRDSNPVGLAVEYISLVGEYGGVMDSSITEVRDTTSVDISVYVSQCFQHIYFATSTLWGEGRVFGTDPIVIEELVGTFRHSIQSGVWNTTQLAYDADGINYTIMDALTLWYRNETKSMTFRDICRTPHCNDQCPERFVLDVLQPEVWPEHVRMGIAAVVVAIAVVCILLKACFYLWLRWIEHKQTIYLLSVSRDDTVAPASGYVEEGLKREFPICNADQAISVACLDLHYSVTTRVGKQLKDEKKENFAPIVLNDLSPEDELNGSETDGGTESIECDDRPRDRSSKRESRAFQRIKNALTPSSTGPYRIPTFRPSNENIDESIHRMTNGTSNHRKLSNTHAPLHGRVSRQSNFSQETYDELPLQPSRMSDICSDMKKSIFRTKKKKILKGISVYFNPGEMIGIMGPSGCGKTTFLDILTGRRKSGNFAGQIFINGVPIEVNRNWYISNTGYVIQLARPYYEELTVRENLTLAAWIRLPDTAREKFQRVEQVMDVSGLLGLADTVVGGATGPGLSGGQKRRLTVALQLLKLPSVIFLDEPTSGLDAASSRELLAHLNELAASNRTVVLTIHQPRLEIFHMFDRLVLLSDGKVAYHGVPDKAYEVFVNALRSRYLQQRLIIPDLEDRNPADVIMDMLGNQRMRQLITDYYQCTDEPKLVTQAVKKAWCRERKFSQEMMGESIDGEEVKPPSKWEQFKFILKGPRKAENTQNHLLARLAALEGRASKRATPFVVIYLPVIFFAYGVLLGTVYLQQEQPLLIMSGFCVYSVASALFMFPALYTYYQKALEIYMFEHADSAGRAYDLVIQPFIRFITMAIIPVVACALILYVLLVHYTRWSWIVFGQLVIVNVALNQAWVALLIWLIITFPKTAIRLSPPLAAVMGFTSGFFIPVGDIPWWYRWLTFINPNYYGFSASAFLLLEDFESDCGMSGNATVLECYAQSGAYVLTRFDFDKINPYYNISILLAMTIFFLLLSVLSNWWNHATLQRGMKKVKLIASRLKRAASADTASLFSTSMGYGEDDSDEEVMSYAGDVDEREGFLEATQREEGASPLSPIAEKREEVENGDLKNAESENPEHAETRYYGNHMWDRLPRQQGSDSVFPLPTSLPEIPSAVSPYPETEPSTARDKWRKAVELTLDHQTNGIEMDTFARSEPPTPQEKHVAFNNTMSRRRDCRMHSHGDGAHHRVGGHRKKSVRSVYLRDGEIHSVWKPKRTSLTSPTTPSPPPTNFADVVSEVMRQKLNLRERQRKLFSRVTATQAVLKEQNEELATVAELTEDEDEEKVNDEESMSERGRVDTPGKKMWQQAIKTVIDENKDDEKKKKRNRKRSTVHFHEVVTNKLASMDPSGARGCPPTSEQGGAPQVTTKPQRVRRNPSLSRKRQDATTPSGAIPFSEWRNKYYEKQRTTRHRSEYIKSRAGLNQGHLHRITSDNDLTLPAQRRASIASAEDLEPRSKSVSQYHPANASRHRRSSSPAVMDYDDRGDMSDGSVALDMFSPLSSRSVSPSVFSDEEERRSKMQSRTPIPTDEAAVNSKPHPPLMQLDSLETRVLSNPSNMTKRAQKRNQYRKMYQDSAQSGDDVTESETQPERLTNAHGRLRSPRDGQRTRLKPDSISLTESPRHTPSPRPTTPATHRSPSPFGKPQRGSALLSPEALNDRISKEQSHRVSKEHLEFDVLEEQRYNQVTSPGRGHLRRSSTPDVLNPVPTTQPSVQTVRRKSIPSPPPYLAPLPGPKIASQTPGGHEGRHPSPGSNS